MSCIDENGALAIVHGDEVPQEVRAHVAGCETCRRFVADLARVLVSDGPASLGGWGALEGQLAPGTRLGDYVIETLLGRGGMGVVYEGRDTRLKRTVAIKVLRERVGTRRAARLRREAEAMARVSHPNIAEVFDVGQSEVGPFVVMERVRGETLSRWLATSRPAEEVIDAFVQAARGLHAAHCAGVIHRDFKPSNAMRVTDGDVGRIKVLDFGLASATRSEVRSSAEGHSTSTMTGVGGTPRYAAPEQFTGEAVTAASDQFSVCVALFEALTGDVPFAGQSASQRRTAMLDGLRRPLPPDVRPAVTRALERGLSLCPEDRFGSMDALARALEARPSRWPAMTIGAVAIGALGWMVLPASEVPCADGVARLEEAWPRPRASTWTTRTEVEEQAVALDAYVDRWAETRRQLCETRKEQPARFEAGAVCLERLAARVERVAGRLDRLATSDDVMPSRPLGDLLEPESCLEAKSEAESSDLLRAEFESLRAAALAIDEVPGQDPTQRGELEIEGHRLLQRAQDLGDTRIQGEVAHLLAVMASRGDRYGEAERLFEEAFFLADLVGDSSAAIDVCENLVVVLVDSLREFERAGFWAEKAGEIAAETGRPKDRGLALLLAGLVARMEPGGPDAIALFDEAEPLLADDFGRMRLLLSSRGEAYLVRQDWNAARADLQEVLRRVENELGRDHVGVVRPLGTLATLEIILKNFDLAESMLERAVSLTPDDDAFGKASLQGNLAILYQRTGKLEQALASFEEVATAFEALVGPEHEGVIQTRLSIVETKTLLGRTDEALREVERLISLGLGPKYLSTALFARASLVDDPRPDLERILTLPNEPESTYKAAREGLASLDAARPD